MNAKAILSKFLGKRAMNVIRVVYRSTIKCLFSIRGTLLYIKLRKFVNEDKIVYLITPPPKLKNVGDQAQVVAIRKWLSDNFKGRLVLEFNKDETLYCMKQIKKLVRDTDLIFLHSGGNLGDRGIWSETARRSVIENFPDNKIISLPQTIYFSDTVKGRAELKKTKGIYNKHKNLTVLARDSYSYDLAKDYFPKLKVMCIPDFVLYFQDEFKFQKVRDKSILLCLREDGESAFDAKARRGLFNFLKSNDYSFDLYDTTINNKISVNKRRYEFKKTLKLFSSHEFVITDRFHGVIFSILTKTPCIVINTVDHKLTEGIKWFKDVNFVSYVGSDLKAIEKQVRLVQKLKSKKSFDFKKKYFVSLKQNLDL